jgi:hypothetical protein
LYPIRCCIRPLVIVRFSNWPMYWTWSPSGALTWGTAVGLPSTSMDSPTVSPTESWVASA